MSVKPETVKDADVSAEQDAVKDLVRDLLRESCSPDGRNQDLWGQAEPILKETERQRIAKSGGTGG